MKFLEALNLVKDIRDIYLPEWLEPYRKMNWHNSLISLRNGYKVRCKSFKDNDFITMKKGIILDKMGSYAHLSHEDIVNGEWEIVE